jgi:hypothetical protein
LTADRAQGVFDDVLQHLAVPSYADDGILFGPYYEGNEGTAIHNPRFRPFQSPVPFLFVRPGVIGDWEFFLDNDDWLNLWARRYGESAVQTLVRNYAIPTGGSSDSEAASHRATYVAHVSATSVQPRSLMRTVTPMTRIGVRTDDKQDRATDLPGWDYWRLLGRTGR